MSWLAFASNTTNDLSGSLTWIKQAGSKSKYYPGRLHLPVRRLWFHLYYSAPTLS